MQIKLFINVFIKCGKQCKLLNHFILIHKKNHNDLKNYFQKFLAQKNSLKDKFKNYYFCTNFSSIEDYFCAQNTGNKTF